MDYGVIIEGFVVGGLYGFFISFSSVLEVECLRSWRRVAIWLEDRGVACSFGVESGID